MKSENISKKAVTLHRKLSGKISIKNKCSTTKRDIPLIYTPGVAAVSREIIEHPEQRYFLTSKGNNIAIITDGTRLLGLGNVGPNASIPVMEGKSVLYKRFGKVNAFPLCLKTSKKREIVTVVKAIEPMFGAINLEDIESPKVFDITKDLEKKMDIPIFHDDRHGTSVAVYAALVNALKLVYKDLSSVVIVIGGAGSAGYGIFQLARNSGCSNVIVVDSKGIIYKGRKHNMNKYKEEIAAFSNPKRIQGNLSEALKGADVFIGVTGIKDLLTSDMVKMMKKDPIIFALSNPDPEIKPYIARQSGSKIVATGSYLYPNRVNNAIVFPYLMRAILDLKIKKITLELLRDTAVAIATSISNRELDYDHLIPDLGNKRIQGKILKALTKYKQ